MLEWVWILKNKGISPWPYPKFRTFRHIAVIVNVNNSATVEIVDDTERPTLIPRGLKIPI